MSYTSSYPFRFGYLHATVRAAVYHLEAARPELALAELQSVLRHIAHEDAEERLEAAARTARAREALASPRKCFDCGDG
ncbi:MAG: hypothetical protein J2P47_05745, partial [Acetobacteraceae bacterium]|nr:hypothetical protein [Acetobacteraceae bacterium]